MCLGGVDRKPPPSDCDPSRLPHPWISTFGVGRGSKPGEPDPLHHTANAPAPKRRRRLRQHRRSVERYEGSAHHPPSRQRENEIGGRRVSGDCIKDGLSKSTCKLPYSLWKRGRSVLIQQTQIGLLTQWLSTIFAETMALNSFAMVNFPTPGKPMSTMRTHLSRHLHSFR